MARVKIGLNSKVYDGLTYYRDTINTLLKEEIGKTKASWAISNWKIRGCITDAQERELRRYVTEQH